MKSVNQHIKKTKRIATLDIVNIAYYEKGAMQAIQFMGKAPHKRKERQPKKTKQIRRLKHI